MSIQPSIALPRCEDSASDYQCSLDEVMPIWELISERMPTWDMEEFAHAIRLIRCKRATCREWGGYILKWEEGRLTVSLFFPGNGQIHVEPFMLLRKKGRELCSALQFLFGKSVRITLVAPFLRLAAGSMASFLLRED